jgi:hypothetical protein
VKMMFSVGFGVFQAPQRVPRDVISSIRCTWRLEYMYIKSERAIADMDVPTRLCNLGFWNGCAKSRSRHSRRFL